MKPILYEKDEAAYTTNGLGRLNDCIDIAVTKELNSGIIECDFTYPVTGQRYDQITLGRSIAVTADDTGDIQPFDIVGYTRPINGLVTFHAVHVSYRLARSITKRPALGNGVTTVGQAFTMFEAGQPALPFHYTADLSTNTGFMGMTADNTPRSVREFIGGGAGSFIDTYNAEVIWDKFNVRFVDRIGQQRSFKIRYGVNLAAYNEEVDNQSTFTTAYPYWKNGDTVKLGGYVSSGLTPVDRDYCVALDLTDKFEDEPTVAQLQTAATNYMLNNQTNLPQRTINVDFIRLQDLEGYEDFAELLKCSLGDTITVIFPRYNVSSDFRIVRTVWDPLQERYLKMTLGSLETTLSEALGVTGVTLQGGGGGGGTQRVFYGTCDTAAATAAKTATITGFTADSLAAGTVAYIKFTNANGVASPTLDINSTGAKAIRRYGSTAPSTSAASSWNAGAVVCLIYDGTNWDIEGWLNTTYSGMTDAEYQAGTSTTNRLITPARLKSAILYHATPANIGLGNVENKSSATIRSEITASNVTTALGFNPVSRTAVCYANSRVDNFSDGQINVTNASLGVTTGAKPVGILLTPSSSTVTMRYHYDGSDATNSNIRAYNLDGTGFSGNLRYFCVVFQNSWLTT